MAKLQMNTQALAMADTCATVGDACHVIHAAALLAVCGSQVVQECYLDTILSSCSFFLAVPFFLRSEGRCDTSFVFVPVGD
jgi:hypothetical protein